MRPFDVETAKKGHPVQTRDGRDVRIVTYDLHNPYHHIGALLTVKKDGWDEFFVTYPESGMVYDPVPHPMDLMLKD